VFLEFEIGGAAIEQSSITRLTQSWIYPTKTCQVSHKAERGGWERKPG
jgi:hypothetical protein